MESFDSVLSPKINLQRLVSKLDFPEDQLERANQEQATLFLEAARYRVQKMRTRLQAESESEVVHAEWGIYHRARARRKAAEDKKHRGAITESYIKEKVTTEKDVSKAANRFISAKVEEEWAKLLIEAYYMRGSAIKVFAELRTTEMAAEIKEQRRKEQSADLRKVRESVEKKYPGSFPSEA